MTKIMIIITIMIIIIIIIIIIMIMIMIIMEIMCRVCGSVNTGIEPAQERFGFFFCSS